jgi:hypothetical protein
MIFIRRFKNGALVDVTTWGRCDAFGDFIPRTIEQSIQINVMGEAKDKTKSIRTSWLMAVMPITCSVLMKTAKLTLMIY